MASKNSITGKILYYEVLRVLAILFVIYDHSGEKARMLYTITDGITYWISIVLLILCKVSVPLFFMISGALILNREEDFWRVTLPKRIFRILLVIFVISLIYYIFVDPYPFSAKYFVKRLITSQFSGTYWYLYAYVAFLIMSPILRTIVIHMSVKVFRHLVGIVILFAGIIPCLSYLIWQETLNPSFNIPFLNRAIIYPILGYFVEYRLGLEDEIKLKTWAKNSTIIGIITLAFSSMIFTFGIWNRWHNPEDMEVFNGFFVIVFTVWIFLGIKYLFRHPKNNLFAKVIIHQGGCVFGIYLFDEIIRTYFDEIYKYYIILGLPEMFAGILWILTMYIIGVAFISFLKIIPVVKKYL